MSPTYALGVTGDDSELSPVILPSEETKTLEAVADAWKNIRDVSTSRSDSDISANAVENTGRLHKDNVKLSVNVVFPSSSDGGGAEDGESETVDNASTGSGGKATSVLKPSSSTAAALFKHLSYDWEARRSILKCARLSHDAYYSIWNGTDCHVLGFKRYCIAPNNPKKKKAFELQEIFKSLACVTTKVDCPSSRVMPEGSSNESGIWVLSDDILINILTALSPNDLVKISLSCHHLRSLEASIMPCMNLKLYPHQQAAVRFGFF